MSKVKIIIPTGWQELQVQDAFTIGRGRVISKPEIRQNPGSYPVYSSQSTNNGQMGAIGTYDFDSEYVTWTTDGAYAGTVFHRAGKFNCTNVCGTLKDNGRHPVHPKFVASYLSTVAKNHVSYVGNPKLMNGVFAEIQFLLPPLPEQQKIATILSSVDDVIEKTRTQIDKLKDLKTGMMQELLTKGIGHTEFKDSPVGLIPAKWDVKFLPDISENHDSKRVPIKSVDRANMKGGYRYYGASGIIDYVNDYIYDGTYILLGEDGENVLSRNLPLAFIVKGKFWVNNHAHVLKANPDTDINFLCEYLESIDYANIASGSAQPKITQTSLNSIQVPVPPLAEQKVIAAMLKSVDEKIQLTDKKLNQLRLSKKALMQDLLTGKVRVKLTDKESAAV